MPWQSNSLLLSHCFPANCGISERVRPETQSKMQEYLSPESCQKEQIAI